MPPTPVHTAGRLRLRPSRYGLIFIGMLVAMLAGSANYHSNLGLVLTFWLGAMAVVSAVDTRRGLRAIRVVSAQIEPVFAGETAIVRLTFTSAIPAVLTLGFAAARLTRIAVVAGANQAGVAAAARTRGVLDPGLLEIGTDRPLGLVQVTFWLDVTVSGLVYPRPLTGPPPPVRAGARGPGRDNAVAGSGAAVEDFKDLRAYQPGDRLQHIAWKGFSRGRGLFTKQFGDQSATQVILEWEALGPGTVEQRLSWLCHGVMGQHRRQAFYGLRLPGQVIAPGSGPVHKHRCLSALALFRAPTEGAGNDP